MPAVKNYSAMARQFIMSGLLALAGWQKPDHEPGNQTKLRTFYFALVLVISWIALAAL
jgi:hypothetical protein